MLLFNLVNLITNKMCWHSYTPHIIEIIAEASSRVPVFLPRPDRWRCRRQLMAHGGTLTVQCKQRPSSYYIFFFTDVASFFANVMALVYAVSASINYNHHSAS